MKKLLHLYRPLTLAAFLLALLPSLNTMAQREFDEEVTLQTFYDELEPYGQWVDDPEYGYVWVPDVEDPDFRPYSTNGHWVMTEYGNTWVSDYDWGWAPFHYGRWAFTDYYGWIWIPDTEWGPAWVNWRSNDEYYGWAPLGPDVTVDAAIAPDYYAPDPWWTFVPRTYIYHDRWYDYYVPYYRNRSYITATIIIGNTYRYDNRRYLCGPDIYDLRRGGINVNIFSITNINRPGRTIIRNNYVNIYRPRFNNNRGDYRPGRLVSRDNFHRDRRDFVRGGNYDRNRRYSGNANGIRGRQPGGQIRNGNNNRPPMAERRFNGNSNRRPEIRGNERPSNERRMNGNVERRPNNPGNNNGRQFRTPENRGSNPGNRTGAGSENRRFNSNSGNRPPQREYRGPSTSRGNGAGNSGNSRVNTRPSGGGSNREINRGGSNRGGESRSGSGNGNNNNRGRRGG